MILDIIIVCLFDVVIDILRLLLVHERTAGYLTGKRCYDVDIETEKEKNDTHQY